MSAKDRNSTMVRAACALLALYPQAYRARYGDELRAVLGQGQLTTGTLLDLLRGALDAHLHPGRLLPSPAGRLRGTVSASLTLWIALVVVGAGFAKATEDGPFQAAQAAHPLLGGARIAVAVLAIAAAGIVLVAGTPLALSVLRQGWREQSRSLRWAIVAPVAGVVFLVVLVAALKAALPQTGHGNGTSLGHAAGVLLFLAVVLVAGVFAVGGHTGIHKARLRAGQLALAGAGAWLLARVMAATALATALYTILLAVYAPDLEGLPNSPLQISTSICLAVQVGAMVLISALALVTARRGLGARPAR